MGFVLVRKERVAMFGIKKRPSRKWTESIEKMKTGTMTIQQFVNLNEKCVLYYSTPFGKDAKTGQNRPYALANSGSNILFLPAFTSLEACKKHFESAGRSEFIIIKGTLKDALSALDSHSFISSWGLVVNPDDSNSVGFPPHVRVQPKCLRD